jgi:Tol biopolymer transport system component
MARAVTIEPNLDKTPARVHWLLKECLKKEPDERLRWIGDAARFLEEPIKEKPTPGDTRLARARLQLLWPASLLAVAAVALWLLLRPVPHGPIQAIRIAMPISVRTNVGGALAISPDGSRIAYTSGPESGQLYVRALDQLEGAPLAGTEGASYLCFSPDGQQICFVTAGQPGQSGQLKKVSLAGGPVQTLMEVTAEVGPPTLRWGEDGNILITDNGVLKRISANGGNPVILAKPEQQKGEVYYHSPQLLPGGKEILFSSSVGPPLDRLFALNLATGEKKLLLETKTYAAPQFIRASPSVTTGYLTYLVPGTASLMAVAFDAETLRVKGQPVPVLEGVRGYVTTPFPFLAISNSGTLVYVPRTASLTSTNTLAWVDRKGAEQSINAPPRAYGSARISPTDSNRLALSINSGGVRDIWVYDLTRGTMDRITTEGNGQGPVWTPDGKHIVYERMTASEHPAVMWAPADRSAPPSVLATSEKTPATTHHETPIAPASVSSDGKTLFGWYPLERWLWTLPLNGAANSGPANSETPRPLLEKSQFGRVGPAISPDGHWLAYTANDSGRYEVYVTSYPEAGPRITVSTDSGTLPFWSRNGRELFFRSAFDRKLMAVDIESSPSFHAGRPKVLLEGRYNSYDITPYGRRFLVIKAPPAAAPASGGQVTVVFNWLEELHRRVPSPK